MRAARLRGARGRLGRWLDRLPLVVVIPVLAALALGGWIVAQPIGSGPDDDFHLASTWCANGERPGLCAPAESARERQVPIALVTISQCFAMHPEESAACQPDPSNSRNLLAATDRVDTGGAYPPVYYAVMNVFASPDVTASAMAMRIFTLLLLLAIGLVAFRLLPRALRPVLLLTWTLFTMPLGLSLLAVNNPSAWALIGCSTAWLAMWGFLTAQHRRRMIGLGILSAVCVVMAAGSRADAALYTALALGAAAVLALRRGGGFWRRTPLLVVLWIFCGLMVLSARQTSSAVGGFSGWQTVSGNQSDGAFVKPDPVALLVDNVQNLPSLWTGIFGGDWGLGWLDTPVPVLATFAALIAAAGVAFTGIRVMSVRKALMVAGLVFAAAAVPLYVLQKSQAQIGREVQPRYLLPLLMVLGGMLLFDVTSRRTIRLGFSQSAAVWVALSLAQALALQSTLRRYITGTDVGGLNLDSHMEWWWSWAPAPMVVLVGTSLVYSLLVALILFVVHRQATAARLEGPVGFAPVPAASVPALS